MVIDTSKWDKITKRIVLGLVVSALVAAFFLLLGIYIVGAEVRACLATPTAECVVAERQALSAHREE
jgi:hypothetical protein